MSLQSVLQPVERLQRALQVLDDLIREHVGTWQVVQIGKRLVLDPENVEARLVALHQLLRVKPAPAALGVLLRPRFLALVAVLRIVAGDKILQILVRQRVLFEPKIRVMATQ